MNGNGVNEKAAIQNVNQKLRAVIDEWLAVRHEVLDCSHVESMELLLRIMSKEDLKALGLEDTMNEYLGWGDRETEWNSCVDRRGGNEEESAERKERTTMKYEDSKVKGITKRTLRALERIAMEADYSLEERGGIEARGGDSVDFIEVGVYGIQTMLEKAYLLGKADGMKKAQK